jgi:hypothetical protein
MDRSKSEAIEYWLETLATNQLAVFTSLDMHHSSATDALLAAHYSLQVVQVGRNLGEWLLSAEPGRCTFAAEQWILDQCREVNDHRLMFTGIDILFHPNLDGMSTRRIDPLSLFHRASRLAPVVVMWPGSFDGLILKYAEPTHNHYRSWRQPSGYIRDMNV